MKEDFFDRFSPEPNTGCWLWTRGQTRNGYGLWWHRKHQRLVYIHRHSFELLRGPIPKGMQLDHLCRMRCCGNPDHLEIVTNRENCLRGISPAARNARKTHCKRGHAFTEENTRFDGKGRQCRQCDKIRAARYKS